MTKDVSELAFVDYWNHRYIENEGRENAYDWFRDWDQLGTSLVSRL